MMLPLTIMNVALNNAMAVETKAGEQFNGHLTSCDSFMNIVLRDVYQTNTETTRFWKLKECYIRGSSIKSVQMSSSLMAAAKTEDNTRRLDRNIRRGDSRPGSRGRGAARGGAPRRGRRQ